MTGTHINICGPFVVMLGVASYFALMVLNCKAFFLDSFCWRGLDIYTLVHMRFIGQILFDGAGLSTWWQRDLQAADEWKHDYLVFAGW